MSIMENKTYTFHYEESAPINASAAKIFAYADDHARLSAHMSGSSWMMGGGRMELYADEGNGRTVGSHIRLSGTAFGIAISLDEVVTQYEPSRIKIWETVGTPRLLVIGHYRMGFEVTLNDTGSVLRVFIGYDMPATNAWLGRLFGAVYAKWCVRQIVDSVRGNFNLKSDGRE